MAELLQLTIDKFTLRVAADRLYAAEGIWVQTVSTKHVRLGVSDYFQQHNGDVAFADIRPVDSEFRRGDGFAEIETMKVTIEVVSPVTGTVTRVNPALATTPELINQDPYGEGWLAEIEAGDWGSDRAQLLDATAYLAVMKAEAEMELKA